MGRKVNMFNYKIFQKAFPSLFFFLFALNIITNATTPSIEITSFPPYGETGEISGRVHGVDPAGHSVALYIFIEGSGWWTKPTFDAPLIPIGQDSTWQAQMTSGEVDRFATQVRVFVIPAGVLIPIAAGFACLPDTLEQISVAAASVLRQ
ncbi:MAG: hypothetical protein GF353_06485, partial [Candidatus Lokiarchaeota archaeon]|nr:hypothetical protein [Candidatus Lokiarchaeota archaeon]